MHKSLSAASYVYAYICLYCSSQCVPYLILRPSDNSTISLSSIAILLIIRRHKKATLSFIFCPFNVHLKPFYKTVLRNLLELEQESSSPGLLSHFLSKTDNPHSPHYIHLERSLLKRYATTSLTSSLRVSMTSKPYWAKELSTPVPPGTPYVLPVVMTDAANHKEKFLRIKCLRSWLWSHS